MTSKSKCPFCGKKLTQSYFADQLCCEKCWENATERVWQALIQSLKDLADMEEQAEFNAIMRIIGRQHRHLSDDHKKPRSTNIALRQKIAVLEQNNKVLQQKCEEYLGKLTEAKKALDWIGYNRLAENPIRVEQLRRHARNAIGTNKSQGRLKSAKTVVE